MEFDYAILRERIDAGCGRDAFARCLGMSRRRLESLLETGGQFTYREMLDAALLLGLDGCQFDACFFTIRVQNF